MIQIFGEQITLLELAGAISGVVGVLLTAKENILCFPIGIVNVSLYAWLFFQSKLYSDSILQIIYLILLAYGWYEWTIGKKNKKQLEVSSTSGKMSLYLWMIGIISTFSIGMFFKYNSDASLPLIDALTTSMSLIAQWMVARKKIENWIIWIAADIIYIFMYVYKHLYLTSILYFIFIILAVIGWVHWRKDLKPSTAD
jgi:nicotinamide mononucleotide transporter